MIQVQDHGDAVVLVDGSIELVDGAPARLAAFLRAEEADLAYADETRAGLPFPKPVWSPERLRCQPYLGGIVALRRALWERLELADGPAALYDLQLRAGEEAAKVAHLPEVLSEAPAPGLLTEDHVRACQEHLDRLGISGTVARGEAPGTLRISRRLDPARRVSIVLPTRGSAGELDGTTRVWVLEAVRTALAMTRHDNLELVVVYDAPTPSYVLDELAAIAGDRLVLVRYDKPFSHSEKCNLGVLHSSGDRIVVFNDDVEVITDGWLEELVAPLDEPDVGLTGAKLYYADRRVQHAGHLYADRNYHHVFHEAAADDDGPFEVLRINREASGVTAAVAALRRETYLGIGGFSEVLPTSYNDIDLCYKVRRAGLRIVWLAGVELFHFASRSRGKQLVRDERVKRQPAFDRWGVPEHDDYLPAGAR